MQTALLLTVLAPAAVGAALVALAVLATRGDRTSAGSSVLALLPPALIPAAGALAACVPVRGWPGLPPTDASLWPIWVGFLIAGFAALEAADRLPIAARWVGRVVVSAGVAALVAEPLMNHQWSAGRSVVVVTGAAALTAGCWGALARPASAVRGAPGAAGLAALCATSAAALGASGTALLAQVVGGMATSVGLLFVAGLKWSGLSTRAVVGPVVALLGGFVLSGALYAEVQLVSVALLAAAPLALGLVPWPSAWTSGLRGAIAQGLTALVLGGAAVGVALAPAEPGSDDSSSDDNGEGSSEDDYDGYGY